MADQHKTDAITPKMVEAGQWALAKWESSFDPYSANCVTAVYGAMVAAKPKPKPAERG